MNYLDILILILSLWFCVKGAKKGFIMELVTLVSLVAGIYIAVNFSFYAIDLFHISGKYTSIIAFSITFIAVIVGLHFLGKLASKLLDAISLGIINRISGLLIGLFKAWIVLATLILLWNYIDDREEILSATTRNESLLFRPIESSAKSSYDYLSDFFIDHKKIIHQTIDSTLNTFKTN